MELTLTSDRGNNQISVRSELILAMEKLENGEISSHHTTRLYLKGGFIEDVKESIEEIRSLMQK